MAYNDNDNNMSGGTGTHNWGNQGTGWGGGQTTNRSYNQGSTQGGYGMGGQGHTNQGYSNMNYGNQGYGSQGDSSGSGGSYGTTGSGGMGYGSGTWGGNQSGYGGTGYAGSGSGWGSGYGTYSGYGTGGYGASNYGTPDWSYTEVWLIPGPHTGRGPRGYQRSDERIQEDINERLTQHGQINAQDINVNVQQGEVTLTGHVDNRQAKRMAEDIADNVSGVKDVHNQLRVRRGQNIQSGQQGQNQSSQQGQGQQDQQTEQVH